LSFTSAVPGVVGRHHHDADLSFAATSAADNLFSKGDWVRATPTPLPTVTATPPPTPTPTETLTSIPLPTPTATETRFPHSTTNSNGNGDPSVDPTANPSIDSTANSNPPATETPPATPRQTPAAPVTWPIGGSVERNARSGRGTRILLLILAVLSALVLIAYPPTQAFLRARHRRQGASPIGRGPT
jgi:hypothetical protein